MPCFQGLAVSIHTPDGPLPEYSIQKNSRTHRITSYIPVPPAKIPPGSTKPEQSTFAISITLLTPGLNVPYSTPKPTPEDPYPRSRIVGGLPGSANEHGKYGPVIGPYIPLTASPNETIAAYIYFDGRPKEEVATLLRRGEETWVNSRWVSVPESEGGGLAEREFLFREVGLERWLNGLDLEGKDKDVAERIERRKQRLEKKRRKKENQKTSDDDAMDEENDKTVGKNGVLRYGEDKNAPVEALSADEGLFTSDSDSDDEPPMPEAAGQIKVALYRVLASGEIKRGEYSPQFDAHDDDDGTGANGESGSGDADVDHTTSFAKPKSLDPKSISTQTVTGIDPPDKPYAVFTFLYRGEKQLRKMGILASAKSTPKTPTTTKRKSVLDFSTLKPLTTTGTRNFAGYRDPASNSPTKKAKGAKAEDEDAMDSDADDEDDVRIGADDNDDLETKLVKGELSAEELARQRELAEGVRQIKLKRAHSAEPAENPSPTRRSPFGGSDTPGTSSTNALSPGVEAPTSAAAALAAKEIALEAIGSPFKKQRASLSGFEEKTGFSGAAGAAASSSHHDPARSLSEGNASIPGGTLIKQEKMDEDEEL